MTSTADSPARTAAEAWSQHVAGPAGDHIPDRLRSPVPPTAQELRQGRPVVLDRPAEEDLEDLPRAVLNRLLVAVDAIEEGRAALEAKVRDLAGVYTVRLTNSWRAALYFGAERYWHLFWVGDHNYEEATRRWSSLRTTASLAKTGNASRQYLEMTRKMLEQAGMDPPEGAKFRSTDSLILAYGKEWRRVSPTLPEGLKRGPMKQCYTNAFQAAVDNPDLTYCEGYATAGFFPMMHAWVVDGEGVVHDPTWERGGDYFGVPFDTDWLRSHILSQGHYGVFAAEIPTPTLINLLRNGIPSRALNRTGSSKEAAPYSWDEERSRVEEARQQRARQRDLPFTGQIRRMSPEEVEGYFYLSPGVDGVMALQGDEEIGRLLWNTSTHVVEEIQVESRWRRKGIGRRMLAEVRRVDPQVRHSDLLTEDGEAWSRATGSKSATKPLPEGYEIIYTPGGRNGNHQVAMLFQDQVVGYLQWVGGREVWGGQRLPDGTIENVLIKRPPQVVDLKVKPAHQRKGLATALWEEARNREPDLVHDDIVLPDGEAWVKSLSSKTAGTAYHYAPVDARSDIAQHGLDWRRSPAAGRPQDPRNQAPVAVYFSPTIEAARDMGLGPDYDLYEVDISGLDTTPDPYQPEDAFYSLDVIPPERIKRIRAESRSSSLGSRLWWRVHPEHREFMAETATSTPFFPDKGARPQPGFSCTDSPWHLWVYVREQFGYRAGEGQEVIGFTGRQVGTGHDSEPLVAPDMGTIVRYSWEEFLRELVRTPFPPTPRGPFTWLSHYATWEACAEQLEWMDTGDPVEDHIVKAFGSAPNRRAASVVESDHEPAHAGQPRADTVPGLLRGGAGGDAAQRGRSRRGSRQDIVLSGGRTAARTVQWARNPERAGDFGNRFGQDIEPVGRYLVEGPGGPGWQTGTIVFESPLEIEFGGGYEEPSNWKRVLSDRYEGKRGTALSRAVVADGYDAIITHDKYGTAEIVDLTSLAKSGSYSGSTSRAPWTPFQPPSHLRVTSGGDAVPGGYNGYYVAWEAATGKKMGYLDYQSGNYQGEKSVTIAMVEVEPEFRRQGVATVLLQAMRHDFEGYEVDPGMSTLEGSAWWRKVGGLWQGRTAATKHTVTTGDYVGISFDYERKYRGKKDGQEYLLIRERTSMVARTLDGRSAGYLTVVESTNEIGAVNVMVAHQRQGLATEMLKMAREQFPGLAHTSVPGQLSPSGEAWSKVVGSKTAASKTLYRGLNVELDGDDLDGQSTKQIEALILRRAMEGTGTDGIGNRIDGRGAGVHWTTNKQVALNFSDPMARHSEEKKTRSDDWSVSVPVVMTAAVADADFVTDEQELRDAMVEGIGWIGVPSDTRIPEDEVLVRDGARLTITTIEAAAPADLVAVAEALHVYDGDSVRKMRSSWRRIGGGVQTTAALAPRTLWHVTRSSNFIPHPNYAPRGYNGGRPFGAGLFLTQNPELWHHLWGIQEYGQAPMYAAEVDVSALGPGEIADYGLAAQDKDQWFVDPEALGKIKVLRTVPIKVAEREARRKGFGFALLARDVIDQSRLCVIDHKRGWGETVALCGGVTTGDPERWTDLVWGERMATCPECKAKIR